MAKQGKVKWVLLLLLATIIWGGSFLAQLTGSDNMGKYWLNGIRFLIGGAVLIIPALLFERKEYTKETIRKTAIYGFISGLLLFGGVTFQQIGVKMTQSPGISAFITDLYTLFVPVFMFLIFKHTIAINKWIGIFVALLGLYFLCILNVQTTDFYGSFSSMLSGEIVLFIGTIFFTFHVIAVDRMGSRLPSLLYSICQFTTLGFVSCLLGVATREPISIPMIQSTMVPILYLGILSVGVGYTCQMLGQKHLDSTLCVLIFPLESVFSTVIGVLFGKDELNVWTVLGCFLILAGLILSELDFKKLVRRKA